MKRPTRSQIESLTRQADDAFWQVMASAFPKATTGDLSPLTTVRFSIAAEAAVAEWIELNCR